jgi:hypothetical protein
LKEVGITPSITNQTSLIPDEITLDEATEKYMQGKQCLIWLGSNEKGAAQHIKCNQFYISKQGSLKVDQPLPLTFEEVFNIWECYFKGKPLEEIYWTVIFDYDNVGLSDIRLVVWALLHGKCNFMLNFIKEDRYPFDFKKYLGRF